MIITVFAKNRTTKDGRKFQSYITKLAKKDGTTDTVSVKFPPDEAPKEFPCNIVITDKGDCNISEKEFVNTETGVTGKGKTLWVKKYTMGEPYVDHSLDDYVF